MSVSVSNDVSPLQAITTPCLAVSHIMLEAYKKYIVVSLIVHGKVSSNQLTGILLKLFDSNALESLFLL